ncbi:MAG: sensor histidine kinase [Acidimicrobiales bacterium]
MTAEIEGRTNSGLTHTGSGLWTFVALTMRRIPQRIRERRFWHVQAMMVGATLPHYVVELAGLAEPFDSFRGLAITLYVIPLLYAAINFGWEGALLTAIQAAAMMSPSMARWHSHSFHWLADLGQLAVTLPVGLLVAWRIDKESVLRQKAETTSARLALLNEIGESLSQTLEVEQQLPGVLRRLRAELTLQTVWLVLEPDSENGEQTVILEGQPVTALGRPANAATGAELRLDAIAVADDSVVVIPLTGEGGPLGALGAMTPAGETLAGGQIDLLSTVGHEIRVAVENARLYRERQENLQSYVRQVTQAQEEERLRISRELHDETGQELVHVVRRLEAIGESAEPGQARQIDDLLQTMRDTLKSVRRFSRDLRPAVLDDLGLLAAIEMVVEDTSSRLSVGANLNVLGDPRRVNRTIELALFRIAQEALRNVERHSHATSATVRLAFDDDEIQLSVSDNGCGFSPPRNLSQLTRRGSLGLLGMKERAELVGGRFELRSSPEHGSEVTIRVKAD